jgi:hypothetical protein
MSCTTTLNMSSGSMRVRQFIEGYNIADAYSQDITVSFWAKSSVTGTLITQFSNADFSRTYNAPVVINSANTWEKKVVTVSLADGTASGTWNSNNSAGLQLNIVMNHSDKSGSSEVWQSGGTVPAGTMSWGTSGDTFFITGVQLEAGSVATPFERRPYGTELALCQRYLPAYRATGSGNQDIAVGIANASTSAFFCFEFVVEPRVPPTGVIVSAANHFGAITATLDSTNLFTGINFSVASTKRVFLIGTGTSGLSQGNATFIRSQNADAFLEFTGCEL